MGAIQDVTNMVGARIQEWRVGRKLHNRLMQDFPEGIVGLRNQATISKNLNKSIKARKPEEAVKYAKDQTRKIEAQKAAERRQRYSRMPE